MGRSPKSAATACKVVFVGCLVVALVCLAYTQQQQQQQQRQQQQQLSLSLVRPARSLLRNIGFYGNQIINTQQTQHATTRHTKVGYSSMTNSAETSLAAGGRGDDGRNRRGFNIWRALAAAGTFGLVRAATASDNTPKPLPKKTKILILLSDTGGGHRASARALVDAFNLLAPDAIECEIVDVWTDCAPKPFNKFVKNYQYLAKRPMMWRSLYGFGRWAPFRRASNEWTNSKCNKPFQKCIEDSNPDLIISVHPLCQFVPLRVLRKIRKQTEKKIPFVTVVTDLGSAHPTWFHKDVDKCFVPTPKLAKMARKYGLKEDKISMHGLPIRPEFWSPACKETKDQIRQELGLSPVTPTVFVVGGGDGVGGISKIAKAVGSELRSGEEEDKFKTTLAGTNGQMIVVCGKNEEAKRDLETHDWGDVTVKVLGFTDKMSDLMAVSDCIVTKAGPGTITEATIRGLPIMLSSYLPGQERGNVDFVVNGGFGGFSRKPEVIASTVGKWLQDEDQLKKMSKLSQNQANPNATFEIAGEILEMLKQKLGNVQPEAEHSSESEDVMMSEYDTDDMSEYEPDEEDRLDAELLAAIETNM